MSEAREAAESTLVGFAERDGVVGVALVARDGLPVVHRFARPCSEDAVCAMGAAMMGAADASMLELGGHEADGFEARAGDLWLAGASLDDELIVLLATRSPAAGLLQELVGALRGIMKEA